MKSKPAFPARSFLLFGFVSVLPTQNSRPVWLCGSCVPGSRAAGTRGLGPHRGALLFLLEPQTLAFQSPDGDRDCSEAGLIPVNEGNKTERVMNTDNIWRARDNTDVPALSGNEAFHIGESSGKLGLTSLASIFF